MVNILDHIKGITSNREGLKGEFASCTNLRMYAFNPIGGRAEGKNGSGCGPR